MSTEGFGFVYLSEILGLPIFDASRNKKIGRIADLSATTVHIYPRVTGVLAKIKARAEPVYVPWNSVRLTALKKHVWIDRLPDGDAGVIAHENEILVKKTFLDKQIISTSGYKLVRVNDLQLLVDSSSKENPNLWLVHIDIGFKGLLRRLGWLRLVNAAYRWVVSQDMKDRFVPWKFVQPTTTTNVYGSVHLSADSSKLADAHPADLADILEDLGTDERSSVIESLEPATAAASLQEMPLNIRVQTAEALDSEKLAGIINDMQMDEAVDLLDELTPEKRSAVFAVLAYDKVSEIKELSKLSANSAGSIMNTDFLTATTTQSVKEVLKNVKAESKRAELVYYVYVVDEESRLKGMVTLRQLLTSNTKTVMSEIMTENVISVLIDTNVKRVAQVFFKYNFEAIPVVDDENRIQGIITVRDALKSVFPEFREETAG